MFDVLTFLVVIVALFDWIESAIYKVKVVVVSIDTGDYSMHVAMQH